MRTQTDKPVSTAQIKKIHVLLSQKGLMEEKKAIIKDLTSGRTESTKGLSFWEAGKLINYLSTEEKELSEKKRIIYGAIWKLAWNMGIIYGTTDDDYEMNKAKLNMFCRQRGSVKKNLSEQNLAEICKTHRQFEAMYTKFNNKNSNNEKVPAK